MTIYPTPGDSNVYATGSDQWLIGAPYYNYVGWPGSLNNAVSYQLASGPVIASLGNPSINTGDATGDTYNNIQILAGSPFGGSLYGINNGQPEQLISEGGTNILYGGNGYVDFVANSGPDFMFAQGGGGLADYEVATSGVIVSLSYPSINTGWAAGDNYSNVHDIAGSGYDDVLYGDNHGDNLLGNGGDNILVGGSGNDTLNGGPGANILTGGAGSDWFVFGGLAEGPGDIPMDPLSVLYNAEVGIYSHITDFDQGNSGYYNVNEDDRIDVSKLVTSLNDGSESVGSLVRVIEDTSGAFAWLQFDGPNGWVNLAQMNGLQAGETVGVILNESDPAGYPVTVQGTPLTNTTTTDEWQLTDGQWSASVNPGSHPGADWEVAGIGDFTGDGTSDILWYNIQSGGVDEWQILNGQWAATVEIGAHPGVGGTDPGPGWQIEGVGNFFGNSTSDILWYNAGNNETDIWELQNGQWAASVSPGTHPGVGIEVAGIGDFYNNGTDDILWYNAQTGDVDEWQISNGQWAGSVDLGSHGSGWQVAGVGNFFGPNTASDVLWYNQSTGQTDIWELANGQWQASVNPGNHPTGYEVAAVGNFSGNGTSDILFYNPSTENVDEWIIANGQWAASVNLGIHTGQVAGAGDFTHSGTSDVLWTQYALK